MRRIVLLTFFNILFLFSGNAQPQGNAGQAGEFLRWGIGAKALGLGRAFTSVSDDASALYWNPAGLASLSRIGGTMMFMHLPLREGASLNYIGGAIPLRLFFIKDTDPNWFVGVIQDFKLGTGFVWHSLGEFEFYDDSANEINGEQTQSISERAWYLSASYPLNPILNRIFRKKSPGWARFFKGDLELGFTTKFVQQNLFGHSGKTTSFDLGFKYAHYSSLFDLGLVFRDLNNASLNYKNNLTGDKIPANGVAGISLKPPWAWLRGLLLSMDYEFLTPGERNNNTMYGLEYDFSVLNGRWPFKIRIGANSNRESLTLGININPESIWGNDWLPAGDWTYANDRGKYDAIGPRFSFSLDRNPFTAKYWYLNAMFLLPEIECDVNKSLENRETIISYLKHAEDSKNPGDRAFRYEAAMRIADLEFLEEISAMQKLRQGITDQKRSKTKIQKINNQYEEQVNKFKLLDYGKSEIDYDKYFQSFSFYLQALILSGKSDRAIKTFNNKGKDWGKGIDVFEYKKLKNESYADCLNYLYAYALYSKNYKPDAMNILNEKLKNSSVAKFLYGHILFLEGDFQAANLVLNQIDLNDTKMPYNIYLPITNDCTFGDEVIFLKAASLFKMTSDLQSIDYINEFAKIPRFYPNSDLAKFLTNGDSILEMLFKHYENKNYAAIKESVNKLINSYIKTFTNGTLIEDFYTYNYR